ncbi:uncharacterized protein SPPG_06316 [Spizellomyces punctatus DAOM BR117]|uniref:Ras-GEF domain-containing protein n=1 Tax=Spizellomyces punctatus (strain DAOM BR117) TaxID=645134 RepID=A0A0L0HCM2_SPIPD|nr:uncharacterized protein SPPG_06316 [Spizellomyces punctatus DAOM BR117]KNC98634.1 hypothetical protein SPPG_06316 [Spizellomyces punctatus DAOM BR117]|eukprot:XP_016606674.1 hypothetical protein SPPG_06316 [Spizellomyces punctatus DAOM BR117]
MYCTLHGVPYLPGTAIPVKAKYGNAMILFNHRTGSSAALDEMGVARLEAGGIYTAETLESEKRLAAKSKVGLESSDDNKKLRRHSALPRILSRRTSDSSMGKTLRGLAGGSKAASAASLAGPAEEEEAISFHEMLNMDTPKSDGQQKDASLRKTRPRSAVPSNSGFFTTTSADTSFPPSGTFPSLFDQLKAQKRNSGAPPASVAITESRGDIPRTDSLESGLSTSSVTVASSVPDLRGTVKDTSRRWSAGFPFGPTTTSSDSINSMSYTGKPSPLSDVESDDEKRDSGMTLIDFLNSGPGSRPRKASDSPGVSKINTGTIRVKSSSQSSGLASPSGMSSISTILAETSPPRYLTLVGGKKYTISGSTTTADNIADLAALSGVVRVERNKSVEVLSATLEDYVLKMCEKAPNNGEMPKMIIDIPTENCLALPDPQQATQGAFNIIHRNGVLHCWAASQDEMSAWTSTINTASSNISVAQSLSGTLKGTLANTGAKGDAYTREFHNLLAELAANMREVTGQDPGHSETDDESPVPEGDPTPAPPAPFLRTSSNILGAEEEQRVMTAEETSQYEAKTVAESVPEAPKAPVRPPWVLMKQMSDNFDGKIVVRYEIDQDGSVNKHSIAGGTLDKLIERLADEHDPDQEYIQAFLLTYRHFSTAEEVLERLIGRLNVEPPQNASVDQVRAVEKWRPVIRLRTVSVVKHWIFNHWSPDFVNPAAQRALNRFLDIMQQPFEAKTEEVETPAVKYTEDFQSLAVLLKGLMTVKHRIAKWRLANAPTVFSKASTVAAKTQFLEMDPKDLAHQLTILEHERFAAISPLAFLLHLWEDKKDDPVIAREVASITDMVNGFNQVSYWIATEICTQPELKNRVKVVEKCIKVAYHCRALNNYNTLLAIISGLNLSAVSRLKSTWEAVDPKRLKQLQELELLLAPQGNYRSYRQILDQMEKDRNPPPFIPILSLFMKDLLFINDGNPKRFDNGLINFGKLRTLHKSISRFSVYQQNPYNLPETPQSFAVYEFCRKLRWLNEAALYKYSCLCEMKTGSAQDTIRLRDKWMNEGKR